MHTKEEIVKAMGDAENTITQIVNTIEEDLYSDDMQNFDDFYEWMFHFGSIAATQVAPRNKSLAILLFSFFLGTYSKVRGQHGNTVPFLNFRKLFIDQLRHDTNVTSHKVRDNLDDLVDLVNAKEGTVQ